MNKLDVNSISNQLKAHLATIPDDASEVTVANNTAAPTTPSEVTVANNAVAPTTPSEVTVANNAVAPTTPPEVTVANNAVAPTTPRSDFSCIVEKFDGSTKKRNLPALKAFSIERVPADEDTKDSSPEATVANNAVATPSTEDSSPFELPAIVVSVEDWGGEIFRYKLPPITTKITYTNNQIVIDTEDGRFDSELSVENVKKISVEKINSLPLQGNKSPAPSKGRIVIETSDGATAKYRVPPDTRKISLKKVRQTFGDGKVPENLPDLLKYTMEIFETTEFEVIDDDEG